MTLFMEGNSISKSKELHKALNNIAEQIWDHREYLENVEKDYDKFISLDILEEQFIITFKDLLIRSAEDNYFLAVLPNRSLQKALPEQKRKIHQ